VEQRHALLIQETGYLEKQGKTGSGAFIFKGETSTAPYVMKEPSKVEKPSAQFHSTINPTSKLEREEDRPSTFPPYMDPFQSPFL